MIIGRDELDIAPKGPGAFKPPEFRTGHDLALACDGATEKARKALEGTNDDYLMTKWKLLAGGRVVDEPVRYRAVRDVFTHMRKLESHACFGGTQEVWAHQATSTNCEMRFGIYLPPDAQRRPCPVLYFLSGLTCTEQNFITKAGAQRYAAEHGLVIVAPDTSPRGPGVADAEGDDMR